MFNDILIGVTNFFRDRASWQALEEVIAALFEFKGGEIHSWSVGCVTGEEAYGLAMALVEATTSLGVPALFQIFASDLDERSISYARDGLYPSAIEADVAPERLERFSLARAIITASRVRFAIGPSSQRTISCVTHPSRARI